MEWQKEAEEKVEVEVEVGGGPDPPGTDIDNTQQLNIEMTSTTTENSHSMPTDLLTTNHSTLSVSLFLFAKRKSFAPSTKATSSADHTIEIDRSIDQSIGIVEHTTPPCLRSTRCRWSLSTFGEVEVSLAE